MMVFFVAVTGIAGAYILFQQKAELVDGDQSITISINNRHPLIGMQTLKTSYEAIEDLHGKDLHLSFKRTRH